MNSPTPLLGRILLFTVTALGAARAADAPTAPVAPSEWIDPATGHRIVRISKEPGTASLYFHQNAYSPDGKKMIVVTPEGMAAVNLQTWAIEPLVPGYRLTMSTSNGLEVSRKQPVAYYTVNRDGQTVAMAVNMDTKETKQVAVLPQGAVLGGITADDSMLVGIRNVGGRGRGPAAPAATPAPTAAAPAATPASPAATPAVAVAPAVTPASPTVTAPTPETAQRQGRGRGTAVAAGGQSKQIYTVDLKTGETKSFFPSEDNLSHDNLNHFECNPTDPALMLFAHEGTWSQVDRIWTMRTDGTGLKLMHQRTMPNEIAGHEFFGHDGRWLYYDLQTPQSDKFWIGGVNVKTGERVRYPIERGQWSVHYNVSWDGKVFSGDGGGPDSVANRPAPGSGLQRFETPQNGQWIYLFRPQLAKAETIKVNGEDVKVIPVEAEKLVDMSKHVYRTGREVEPNSTFTPDDKWLVFRSDMEGVLHTYAVEIAKPSPEAVKEINAKWDAYRAATAAAKPVNTQPAAANPAPAQ